MHLEELLAIATATHFGLGINMPPNRLATYSSSHTYVPMPPTHINTHLQLHICTRFAKRDHIPHFPEYFDFGDFQTVVFPQLFMAAK